MADKKLNSLDRFRKQSPRLILEQHSHCEVPAGCGGVVLRWSNPFAALPLVVHLYSPGQSQLYIDSRPVENIGLELDPGPHVLAIALERVDRAGGLFMFAAVHDPKRAHKQMPPGLAEGEWWLLSAPDSTWRATTDALVESKPWIALDFDDSGWTPLARAVTSPQITSGQPGSHQAYWCNRHHAAFLVLPKASASGMGRVWVRRKFVIPVPQTA